MNRGTNGLIHFNASGDKEIQPPSNISKQEKISLSIVIPVYNEGDNISSTLTEISQNVKIQHEILIIYDFPEDNTIPAVNKFINETKKINIRIIKNKYGKGALNAIKSGFLESTGTATLVVMADLSDEISKVNEMYEKISQGYDIVCGSRYMKGGKQIGGPKLKKFLSRLAGISLKYFTGIPTHDISNSFKMYRSNILNTIKIESNGGFELGMEIVVKSFLNGYKITEVPSTWRDREQGASRFKLWKWLPKYLKWYFLAIKHKIFGNTTQIENIENKKKQSILPYIFLICLFIIGQILLSTLLQKGNPMGEFRESQVASTIKLFVEEGINLLYPKLNVMGDPGYFAIELPIYQALTALFWNVFNLGEIWGRIFSHIFWAIGALYLFFLCNIFVEKRVSLLTAFFYLFSPIALVYSNDVSIEGLSSCLSIMFLYHGARWIIEKSKFHFFTAIIICTLGFTQKLPNLAPMFIPLLALRYSYGKGFKSIFSPSFILLGLIPFLSACIWQYHANKLNAMYPASAWYASSGTIKWYFGTLVDRLNPAKYFITALKSFENAYGSLYFAVLPIIGISAFFRKYYFFTSYLASYLFSFLIFTGLHLPHSHYMIPFLPALLFWAAIGIIFIWDKLALISSIKLKFHRIIVAGIITISVMGLFIVNSARYLDFRDWIFQDKDIMNMAEIIKQNTPKNSRVLLYKGEGLTGGTWSPQLMYLSDRRGRILYMQDLEKNTISDLMRERGCNYLVLSVDTLRYRYIQGRKLHRSLYDKRTEYNDLDYFTLQFSQEIEKQLAKLNPVYLGNRIRIYKIEKDKTANLPTVIPGSNGNQ
ncbi:glycosyl transferase family 2 [Candidatus Omnitrophus magneticus]|uniref:Glycosyl transferase family 2 n=1 Tax=Candidatus Omnitrophus magneticus TaxID=1609969 RepID=A0A0F0CTA9_9BACT|nr:glycosyl transferase family 2 [Candidatus Omnitrophus magneticus]